MISSKNLIYHELIGLNLEVTDSSTKSLIGIKGKVIYETKKTFTIETLDNNEKLLAKDISIFQFEVPDGTYLEVDGKILLSRPEDRIKKRYKKI
ncbi:ribonuclease P protein component 1 [uncultured Methanobrevibacter sp.]|uniref:ribonuclease P protein component 1 n=1 Tax=uncultured Methanobrevibacter sp. TaxID=253161 RepID=UPI0025CEA431|nr:ribonuclease P protein component 1 [uncultured Methanobrevibacter sp.]